jgi:hypothetical protein
MDSRRSSQTFTKLPSAHSHHEDHVDGEAYKYDIHARFYLSPLVHLLHQSSSPIPHPVPRVLCFSSRIHPSFLIPFLSSILSHPSSLFLPPSYILSHPSSLIHPFSSILSHPSFLILPLSPILSHPTSTYHPSSLILSRPHIYLLSTTSYTSHLPSLLSHLSSFLSYPSPLIPSRHPLPVPTSII